MIALSTLKNIVTPNLLVREMRADDGESLAAYMTQPRYQRFIAHRMKAEADVRAFVARQLSAQGDKHRQVFHLAVEERYSREVVGDGFILSKGGKTFELGWGLHPAIWRAGFGTEIGRALLGLAFEQLRASAVTCKVMRPNLASAALAKRIGMKLAGDDSQYRVEPGRVEDVQFFEMSQADYFDLPY